MDGTPHGHRSPEKEFLSPRTTILAGPETPRRPSDEVNSMPAASKAFTKASIVSDARTLDSLSIVVIDLLDVPARFASSACVQFNSALAARICEGSTISCRHLSTQGKG